MANRLQKRWIFTWNSDEKGLLPPSEDVKKKLNSIVAEGVFQLEVGEKSQRKHYQGRFKLKGQRTSKSNLLKEFGEIFNTKNLTFEPELSYDSTGYCTKAETRIDGPWYVGLQNYISEKEPMELCLKKWQTQLLTLIQGPLQAYLRNRKVIWVQDPVGGQGKSTFIKYLAMNEKLFDLGIEKLPIDRPDRIRSAVIKLSKKKDIDIYMFDFTRTQGVDTNFQNLFEVIEEIKNSYIVDTMYGNFNRAFIKTAIIIIFTNMDINQLKNYLSDDRWEPFIICKNNDSLDYINLKTNGSRLSFEKYLTSKLKDFAND